MKIKVKKINIIQTYIDPKTITWYCSGCDSLCAFLCDRRVNPEEDLAECKRGIPEWRRED